ncbi:MAG: helicase C-terminal domain-containing protein [Candidatus Dormibacteria bacterium]|jgi:Rad3-related DNA helicase/DNA polymerase III epsilon subunit-like protein
MSSDSAGADETLVCFDLETTGLSPRSDRIIEIGAVKVDRSGVLDTFTALADPGVPLSLVIQRLCGLHDSDLRGQPTPEEAVAGLALFSEGCTLVGHGVGFDMAFCAEIRPEEFAGRVALDTAELARVVLPAAPSHSLEELSRSLGLLHDRPHRALSDAMATDLLLRHLIEVARGLPAGLRERVRQLCTGGGWPTGQYLARHLEGLPAADPAQPRASGQMPSPAPVATAGSGGAAPTGGIDEAFVLKAFGADGALACADPGFELREEQQQMALAVTQAFNRGQTLLVEAGTGVGKSLAYLIPAREWAAKRRERVLVSTHTITLQEQLAQHDLPAADRARPLPLRSAVLKGRGNYLSLRRLERWLAAAAPGGRRRDADELRFKVRALIWAYQSQIGDRSELRLAGRDSEFWERVGSTVDDCLGPACHNWRDGRCFMVKSRLEARDADLVIVNHALLLSDADSGGAVLPEFHHLIIDEAHHLEEAATQAQGKRLSLGAVLAVLDRIPEFGDPAVSRALKSARQAATAAFADLRHLAGDEGAGPGGRGSRFVVLDRRLPGTELWEQPGRSVARLARGISQASSALRAAADGGNVQPELWPQPDNGRRELWIAAEALQGMARVLASALANLVAPDQSTPSTGADQVAWVEVERGDQAVLRTAPVEVAASLREHIFDRCQTVVLTSATLAVAGSFRYIRGRLGLEDAQELVLDSPFDYLRQSLCCLPRGMPAHGDPQHARVVARMVAEIASELGGRTLVLFTGYQALREVHVQLRSLLAGEGIAVLGQGLDGTRNQVLRNFRNNPRTVLLGTNSFWEGIDLPGDVLQCVVIDKLPFPVPTDPIFQARARGHPDSFTQLSLPEAVLRLKQGFGRLVRRHGDRGAVVICDPRILERSYGEEFVRALPKAAFIYEPPESLAPALGAFLRGEMPAAVAR